MMWQYRQLWSDWERHAQWTRGQDLSSLCVCLSVCLSSQHGGDWRRHLTNTRVVGNWRFTAVVNLRRHVYTVTSHKYCTVLYLVIDVFSHTSCVECSINLRVSAGYPQQLSNATCHTSIRNTILHSCVVFCWEGRVSPPTLKLGVSWTF